MSRLLLFLGAVFGLLAVAAGAFGAHGLKNRLSPDMLEVFKTGALYQMFHALALLAAAWVASHPTTGRLGATAGWFFIAGIIIFSGSLYLLALTGARWWGAITPIGGVAFMIGWGLLAAAALKWQ